MVYGRPSTKNGMIRRYIPSLIIIMEWMMVADSTFLHNNITMLKMELEKVEEVYKKEIQIFESFVVV